MWDFETEVSGDRAKSFKILKLDDYSDALGPKDELQSANSVAGTFTFKDATGQAQSRNLGPHSIRIVPKK